MAEKAGSSKPEGFEITPLGYGRYRVSDGATQRLAYAAGPPEARWVFIDGRVYVIDLSGRRDGGEKPAHDDEMALASPMPATVAAIHVRPGQVVAQDDLLIMLEAMKMELPIRAPRNGRVRRIACERGELVQAGVPLVELE